MNFTPAQLDVPEQAVPAAVSTVVQGKVLETFSVIVARTLDDLEPHRSAWDDLAQHAQEPNVFYEPWMFLPAMRAFPEPNLHVVLIYAEEKSKQGSLCGFFPVVRSRGYKKLPVRILSLWQHLYCFLCTPLLRKSDAQSCLTAFYNWAATADEGASLLELPLCHAEGPFQQTLVREAYEQRRLHYQDEAYTRALYQPSVGAEDYWRTLLRRKHRQDYGRLERRLAEQGKYEYRSVQTAAECQTWIDDFLALEAKGWKGNEKTAMGCAEPDRTFFAEMAQGAFDADRAIFLGSYLDDQPVATLCTLRSGGGAFTFKIAYDEAFATFSPGVHTIKEIMRRFDAEPDLRWIDSCAVPDHPMINRLWAERRSMQTTLVSTGAAPGDMIVSILPMLRWLKRKFRRGTPSHKE